VTVREFFDRYGPAVAVVGVLAMLVILMPGNTSGSDVEAIGPAGGGGVNQSGGGPGGDGGMDFDADGTDDPVDMTGAGGSGATSAAAGGGEGAGADGSGGGGGDDGGNGGGGGGAGPAGEAPADTTNCRPDGRQNGFAAYMPPCAEPFNGNNGGATARGVQGDKIIVTRFISQTNAATDAALTGAGADDSPQDTKRMHEALRRYFNTHYETYGREVVYVEVPASGPSDNDEAMRADAIKIADQIGAFANFGGPTVLAEELAQRGVVCLCTVSLRSDFYTRNPPYIFGTLPTVDEYYVHLAEYIGKRLAGRPAKHAGDDLNPVQGFRGKNREFGLIYLEGAGSRVNPDAKLARDFFVQELAKYGVRLKAEASYLFDIARQQQQSTSIISKMRSEGVSNLLIMGDPLYPIFLTQEATRQRYFPEWLISGTGLIDTSFFGRTYDQSQWRNAFGISPLFVFWETKSKSIGWREYFHARPNDRPGDEGVAINVIRAPIQLLFTGIHMAGPNLTADTFAQGMFNYPATGGTPANPLSFFTRELPTQYKDFTEVWWNVNGRGLDEQDRMGNGILMKVDGGKRYRAGQWPQSDPKVFVTEGAVYTNDDPPGGYNYDHDHDGHEHPPDQRCLSCR
jgi:hypothetical protein